MFVFLFDKIQEELESEDNKKKIKSAIGLRYFNVYGPNEYHKKNMSSPILAFYNQIKKKKCL